MTPADWGILVPAVVALLAAAAAFLQAQAAKTKSVQSEKDNKSLSVGLVNTHSAIQDIANIVPTALPPEPLPSKILEIANGIVGSRNITPPSPPETGTGV